MIERRIPDAQRDTLNREKLVQKPVSIEVRNTPKDEIILNEDDNTFVPVTGGKEYRRNASAEVDRPKRRKKLDTLFRDIGKEHENVWNEVYREINLLHKEGLSYAVIAELYQREYLRLQELREPLLGDPERAKERARLDGFIDHVRKGLLAVDQEIEITRTGKDGSKHLVKTTFAKHADTLLAERARQKAFNLSREGKERLYIQETEEELEEPVFLTPEEVEAVDTEPPSMPTFPEKVMQGLSEIPIVRRIFLGRNSPPPESPVA